MDIEGRTDAEIKEAAASGNIDVLSEEEMLYAATLTDDAAALKLKAYQAAATKYNSVRGYNNAGVVHARQPAKLAQAKALFEKAARMSKDAAITNNLGVRGPDERRRCYGYRSYLSALSIPPIRKPTWVW